MTDSRLCQRIASGDLVLSYLENAISRCNAATPFSCTGSVDISHARPRNFASAEKPSCPEPIVFWQKDTVAKSITFRGPYNAPEPSENRLEEMVEDCQPATFGRDGQDVLDEKIRRAGAMNSNGFATNFNPYDCGIVDAVGFKLLPGIVRAGNQPAVERWGVVAKLYKLNVYSAPSGMFKPHFDTPRGHTHFGSLVVALPTSYQGGQLRAVHNGREEVGLEQRECEFQATIRWIAFYSDCEHEVLPVTTGHRVTLTYELWVVDYLGGLTQAETKAPGSEYRVLYDSATATLSRPDFLEGGGVLGIWCAFQYPETFEGTEYYQRHLRTLKGVDAIVFAVFRSLGFTVHIKPYEPEQAAGAVECGKFVDQDTRYRRLLSTEETRAEKNKFQSFNQGSYVGDEIFHHARWLNQRPDIDPAGAGCLADRKSTTWIGNENDIDWDYSVRALFVVVPPFLDRGM